LIAERVRARGRLRREYNCGVDPKDLRAFANRDWAAAARGKQQYWAERYQHDGPAPARQAATLLLEHARRLSAAGLGERERRDDLAHHLALSDRLDRASRALARR
jgi:hypothetical protein